MAGTSLSSQLQALKTSLIVSTDPEPGRRRPLTRLSILFDAKSAADIDLETIFNIALSGLEVLTTMEERFRNFKNDLFSPQSKEVDRELVNVEENKLIDASIGSYLRLLSGYLESHSALKTLEYLIRRYKVHVYNTEDLILCGLPYHDTHVFVQIVQLINTGNSRWKFLDGVKVSGARPPREVIVQQCIRDMGVLEAICNYATPVKKIQPSKQVIGFCTAVIFEVLGLVTVDSDTVKRVLPYVSSGLQSGARGMNQKAGALMIVSLLSEKAALAPNVVKSFMHSVSDIARTDAKETADFQWLHMSFMALINIVQLQSVELIPKKTVDILNEIRDVSGILLELNKEFNIDKFVAVFVDSLLEYSASDEACCGTLLSIVETFPMKGYVNRIISKFLSVGMKISKGKLDLVSSEAGSKGKQILVSICGKYPNEARRVFYSFIKDAKLQPKKVSSSYEILCKILDENLESSHEIPDPKSFFALEHSEAVIRKSAVLSLDVDNILTEKAARSKKFDAIQDAILRRLYDEDLNVVLAVLNLKNLTEILSSPLLIEAIQHVLQRCDEILLSGSSTHKSLPRDAALLCLQQVITSFKDQEKYAMTLATAIFPLLLIRPKTQRLNLKALGLAKELNWPFYENLTNPCIPEKKLEMGPMSSINMENVSKLAMTFSASPEEYIPWLVKCCKSQELSKTLFFLVLLQSLKMMKTDVGQISAFFDSLLPFLKTEWEMLESMGISAEQSKKRILDGDCKGVLEDLLDTNIKDLNAEILACLFLRLLEAFIAAAPDDVSLDKKGNLVSTLQDLFLFFASHSKDVFKKHLEYLFTKCMACMTRVVLELFTKEGVPCFIQVESLRSFSHLCSQLDEGLGLKLLPEFPSILVPLSSDDQDVRVAAMSCIEELFALWSRISKNGNNRETLHFLGELLGLIIQQKKMILSDTSVLASLFTSLLGSSSHSLLVQQAIGKRFDESTKKEILVFMLVHALGLSPHAKLKILSLVRGLGSKLMSVSEVKSLLNDLLERRQQYYLVNGKLCHELSQTEVDILCLLLESCTRPPSSREGHALEDSIVKALQVNDTEDSAVLEPCLTILRNLSSSLYGDMKTETQELVFRKLLILFRSSNGDIQNATRDTLLCINLNCSIVGRVLDSILDQKAGSIGSAHEKKQTKSVKRQNPNQNHHMENTISFMSAFLDVLRMKKNLDNRTSLVGPLFKLLHMIFKNEDWILKASDQEHIHITSSGSHQIVSGTTAYVQQTLLLTLEDICASISNDNTQKDIARNFDMQLLVSCARCSHDAITRNHVFSLITAIARITPDKVLDHILDILTTIGESTVTQWDSYSQRVFEGLISAIVPYWLPRTGNADQLLQIFVNILPQVAEHRRLSIIAHLLRTLGEAESLGSLFFLLFRSLISKKSLFNLYANEPSLDDLTVVINKQWEYEFAVQLSEQYACSIWLRSLISALQKIGCKDLNEETFMEMVVAMQLVSDKLRDPEIAHKLDSGEDLNYLQTLVGDLMEHVVFHLQLLDFKKKHIGVPAVIKNELKEYIRSVLKTITKGLLPSTYFEVIIKLIDHVDRNMRKKALGLLCETMKDFGTNAKRERKGLVSSLRNFWLHLNETSLQSFEKLCSKILALLDARDDVVGTSLKLAAVAALEVLANRFESYDRVFSTCLGSVCKRICSDNSALSSHCLRATGALINALGPKALPELPNIMKHVLRKSRDVSSVVAETRRTTDSLAASPNSVDSHFMSILLTLEAVINKLGGFLNPYLGDILRLIVLHPLLISTSDIKLKMKADVVRKLITDKIPVRLLIPPVLDMFSDAIKSGESSLSIFFEMLGNLVSSMDRSSIGAYHAKVFDLCLLALDLRCQNPTSIKNIDVVEQNVIDAVVTLTMKLTETMFRPLFIKTVEWSGLNVEDDENSQRKVNGRAISFYSLVNKFAESHRSLFVPYFKYLLDGFVQGLRDLEDTKTGLSQKKKKAKLSNNTKDRDDPPVSVENHTHVPSVSEVDDLLVACIGQMAVTAGSDLLWKPLNHEVLMQTRSEKVRARILGLRIIKYLVDKLKEEYLTFLPETIPFLGELLEDSELSVKSLAQEIMREMETMSGESLREYL
ncbi:hypothetical protein RD792_013707 [Penstemon davidsonii]|uniref:BP28 C-terminal domain-containing protein n=1 Tax=Penstemon davidsonii TaxID=160366 RepID=A0ABR0CV49_9LAMI|nr:hypothetical protein RD792_013707 [Penstemon davidsonii]